MSTEASFYVVLFFVIGPIYAAAPLAWALVLYALWTGRVWYSQPWTATFLWAVLEVIFSLYHCVLARRVTVTPPRPPPELNVLQAAFTRVLKAGMANLPDRDHDVAAALQDDEQDEKERGSVPRLGSPAEAVVQLDYHDPRAKHFRECMSTWFRKRPWSQIHTHEMRQWIYWSTFNAHLPSDSQLPSVHKAALDDALAMIEKRAGVPIKQGSNPACKPLLLTLDPVTVHPRPLTYYILVWAANFWIRRYFEREWGLTYGRSGDLEFVVLLCRLRPAH